MSMNFRYPNITGKDEKEQIEQIRRYLFQMVDQLNYVVSRMEERSSNAESNPQSNAKYK